MNISAPIERQMIRAAMPLLPSQVEVLAKLRRISAACPITILQGERGSGHSTIFRALLEEQGGFYVDANVVLNALKGLATTQVDGVVSMICEKIAQHNLVVLDDRDFVTMSSTVGFNGEFLTSRIICAAYENNCRVVTSGSSEQDWLFNPRSPGCAQIVRVEHFTLADQRQFFINWLGEAAVANLDIDLIHRSTGGLGGHDLFRLVQILRTKSRLTTEDVLSEIEANIISSNTRVEEVEALRFEDLPGTDHISSRLETHIIMPLENPALARQLDIRPKRGVLLYGPPGTGKTSVGRALAHRMKGRFFLIDGTVATEPPTVFFNRVQEIVKEAQENAPSVLFIDDADVLFNIVHISGFSRYLLSLLDGMESDSAGKVCLIMTAMNVSKVPSPILRSGRVELWLETRLPDFDARKRMLQGWTEGAGAIGAGKALDLDALSRHTDGFTPADLRRIVGDASSYQSYDELTGRRQLNIEDYLVRSAEELIATRTRMAENLRDDSLRVRGARASEKYGAGIGGLVQASTSCTTSQW